MNRAYHHLTEKAIDCLSMAHCIAKNADYRPDIDAISAPLLQDGIKHLETARRCLQEILYEQMNGKRPCDTRRS